MRPLPFFPFAAPIIYVHNASKTCWKIPGSVGRSLLDQDDDDIAFLLYHT